jgi:hypothetical protein
MGKEYLGAAALGAGAGDIINKSFNNRPIDASPYAGMLQSEYDRQANMDYNNTQYQQKLQAMQDKNKAIQYSAYMKHLDAANKEKTKADQQIIDNRRKQDYLELAQLVEYNKNLIRTGNLTQKQAKQSEDALVKAQEDRAKIDEWITKYSGKTPNVYGQLLAQENFRNFQPSAFTNPGGIQVPTNNTLQELLHPSNHPLFQKSAAEQAYRQRMPEIFANKRYQNLPIDQYGQIAMQGMSKEDKANTEEKIKKEWDVLRRGNDPDKVAKMKVLTDQLATIRGPSWGTPVGGGQQTPTMDAVNKILNGQ